MQYTKEYVQVMSVPVVFNMCTFAWKVVLFQYYLQFDTSTEINQVNKCVRSYLTYFIFVFGVTAPQWAPSGPPVGRGFLIHEVSR